MVRTAEEQEKSDGADSMVLLCGRTDLEGLMCRTWFTRDRGDAIAGKPAPTVDRVVRANAVSCGIGLAPGGVPTMNVAIGGKVLKV